jgi:hypothetical protein
VRDGNARRLQFSNLRCHFSFNLIRINAATDRAQSEAIQTLVKASVRKVFVGESWSPWSPYGNSVHKHHVATDAQP